MSQLKDEQGLEVSTNSADVVSVVDKFGKDLLSMGKGVTDILAQVDKYPENTLIQSYVACVFLYGQTKETDAQAKKYLSRAQSTIQSANEREKLFLSSLESWFEGRIEEGAQKLERLIKEWPEDLISAKVLEFFYYMRGQQYSGARFLKAMETIYEQNKNSGYFLSSYSFATELCGNYEKAGDLAERAVEIEEINPWAHHTLSHVLLKRGDITSGIKILKDYEYIWDRSGQAISSHNYWHLALMHLEKLEYDKALPFLNSQILREKPYTVIQHLDSISLLWRLEMGGFEVPIELWKSISNIVIENSSDAYIPFNSAHYIYALARAEKKDELSRSLSAIKESVSKKNGHERDVWEKTGLPLLEACKSYATENYALSARVLKPVINNVMMVGGSDAQVDLFRQTYLLSFVDSEPRQRKSQIVS